jgi:hypothetical protein
MNGSHENIMIIYFNRKSNPYLGYSVHLKEGTSCVGFIRRLLK